MKALTLTLTLIAFRFWLNSAADLPCLRIWDTIASCRIDARVGGMAIFRGTDIIYILPLCVKVGVIGVCRGFEGCVGCRKGLVGDSGGSLMIDLALFFEAPLSPRLMPFAMVISS